MKVDVVEELEGGKGEVEAEGAEISPIATNPLSPAVESLLFGPIQGFDNPERGSCDFDRLVPSNAREAEEEVRRDASKGFGETGTGRRREVVEVGEPKDSPLLRCAGREPTMGGGGSDPAMRGDVVGGGRDRVR